MKFIHAADLHIDSPLRGLDAYDGAPIARLRSASRSAFIGLVDLAIARDVDIVLLAGDIYDGEWADFSTGLFFRAQLQRLRKADVRVFIVKGNHDAASQITRTLPALEGVHVFSASRAETIDLPELGVAVHGRSFPNRAVSEDLVPGYPDAVAGRFNIGILHTSLNGRAGHDPYAPTTVATLIGKGYDYFALGHVHAREVVLEHSPRIVYPGNLQGRHARELGPKGCELVTLDGGRFARSEFIALDVVRWQRIDVDASGLEDVDALAARFLSILTPQVAVAPASLHALRIRIEGESALHALEASEPGTLAAAVQAACQDLASSDVWVEQVECALRSPFDRAQTALREDAVGEVVRLSDRIAGDDATLVAWCRTQLEEMKGLQGGLASTDPMALDADTLRGFLADAEATILARLPGAGPS